MRTRDPHKVVDEIEMLVNKYGVKEIQIEDDNFTLVREHCVAICEEILKRNIKILWSLPNGVRIDKLDKELLILMKKAGCVSMALGIESANQRILDLIKKQLNKKVVRETCELISEVGIETTGFFMIGFPTETKEEIKNTINFAASLPIDRAHFTKVTPLPGTELFDLWVEKYAKGGAIDWKTFDYYQFDADWSECSFDEISKLQTIGFIKFYSKPKRLFKFLAQLEMTQYLTLTKRLMKIILPPKFYNSVIAKEGQIKKSEQSAFNHQVPSM